MIPVTKPFLPPQEEYDKYLKGIWQRNWLTNMGPLASQLEMELKEYLNINHLLFVTNGTVALQMAIKALELDGEIITTPFSFVATTSSIVWEGCEPVFVDIDQKSLNIDASKIEAAITDKTSAILATHVYGNPCDVDAIEKIAKKYNLKVIYDAAHCFGVKIKGKSIFEYGDISTCSLHATKLYHSIEGGLLFTTKPELLKKLAYIRNFGISGHDSFSELGLNGKNSEFHAAMGLVNLQWVDRIIEKRRNLTTRYEKKLAGFKAFRPLWHPNSENNGAYLPFILESEELLLKIKKVLDSSEIFTRRYFYPSLSNCLPYLPITNTPVSDDIAKRALCLPLYYDLTEEEVDWICRSILRTQNN
ncbi:TPA: DegT/DnrJ/EryC1/StrS family aminotransferase [Elizabethkingia anophelis]|uniref:DegT/DnrJ/EryC1/StrS family aminotransferase n=1 Tax=Elizabethkingia anophelis TaxID=1117645 RepID=UPI00066769F2|nr:DegT/DnrJ/EryC1/StrS family aminotransferase [Elizabethkingia anophelis]AQW91192.1 aminotransferase DegT [Elizabethkingia anophelis]KUY14059.1 aminotransferase DegT [Elizabethkingia anophelis]MCT3726542.1 DegT/DnrJ/EryC1/StrS family aminotransferase [Elizabethkingia anophelis]MCT4237409.1 DegT/DnrJ/EryC1/StrS family aminotransferase [Elizabethkingia anophelis]MCT4318672.1 DegT/DnrJ/EryC1/StrS family aminotransferase [Elizabethkingia anophelis]